MQGIVPFHEATPTPSMVTFLSSSVRKRSDPPATIAQNTVFFPHLNHTTICHIVHFRYAISSNSSRFMVKTCTSSPSTSSHSEILSWRGHHLSVYLLSRSARQDPLCLQWFFLCRIPLLCIYTFLLLL